MNLAAKSFSTSSITTLLHSGANTRLFYWTGFFVGSTLRLCFITCLLIPSILSWLHVKTSQFFFKNYTNLSLNDRWSSFSTLVVLDTSPSISSIFSASSIGLGGSSSTISSDFSSPVGGWEFHFQVVCGSCCLKAIKGWSSKNHIVWWRAVDDKKVYHPCHLSRVSPCCNLQWNDALWIDIVSTETNQWGSEGSEAFWI